MVLEAREGAAGVGILERILREGGIELVEVGEDDARAAIGAWRRFGKGDHPASLSYGDCFVYTLAEATGYPVVCGGDDFAAHRSRGPARALSCTFPPPSRHLLSSSRLA